MQNLRKNIENVERAIEALENVKNVYDKVPAFKELLEVMKQDLEVLGGYYRKVEK